MASAVRVRPRGSVSRTGGGGRAVDRRGGTTMRYGHPAIESVDVGVYKIPTDQPEADGTLAWASTTMVLVEVRADGRSGLGWTYSGVGSATVAKDQLTALCVGVSPMDVPGLNERMVRACRNLGRSGLV